MSQLIVNYAFVFSHIFSLEKLYFYKNIVSKRKVSYSASRIQTRVSSMEDRHSNKDASQLLMRLLRPGK